MNRVAGILASIAVTVIAFGLTASAASTDGTDAGASAQKHGSVSCSAKSAGCDQAQGGAAAKADCGASESGAQSPDDAKETPKTKSTSAKKPAEENHSFHLDFSTP